MLKFILEKQLLHILQGRAYYCLNFPAPLCLWLIITIVVVEKLYNLSTTCYNCYSGCQKTLFDQNNQNDRQNSNANKRDPVTYVVVVSLDCTLRNADRAQYDI